MVGANPTLPISDLNSKHQDNRKNPIMFFCNFEGHVIKSDADQQIIVELGIQF